MSYSVELLRNASTIVITLANFSQSTKNMFKVAKEMLAKGKSSQFKRKHQSTRTMSTLFCCSTSYKVKPFLDFVVTKIFFGREGAWML